MHYARDIVKSYWSLLYRRAFGISMITFAIAMAVGIAASAFLLNNYSANLLLEVELWVVLILISVIVFVFNLSHAHIQVSKHMTKEEREMHTKHTGIWLALVSLEALVLFIPLIFFNSFVEPFMFLFSFGGILWVIYLASVFLYRYNYHEMGIAAVSLWIIFIFGMITTYTQSYAIALNPLGVQAFNQYSLFVMFVSLIVIFGVTGVSMLSNSTSYAINDIRDAIIEDTHSRRNNYEGAVETKRKRNKNRK